MVGTGSYYRKGNTGTRRNGWEEREKRTGMEEMREKAQRPGRGAHLTQQH